MVCRITILLNICANVLHDIVDVSNQLDWAPFKIQWALRHFECWARVLAPIRANVLWEDRVSRLGQVSREAHPA